MKIIFGVLLLLAVGVMLIRPAAQTSSATPAANTPQYTREGKLIAPKNYREWVFLSSGLGMTYSQPKGTDDNPMFSNVFVAPEAYHSFQQTGKWPDRTILIMDMYTSSVKGSINKGGRFQLTSMGGFEAHVKDTSRPGDVWKFYGFGENDAAASPRENGNRCTQCHSKDGAVEDTFVQFYPTLLPIARAKGTLRHGTDIVK